MPVFEEFNPGRDYLQEPEERRPEEIKKGEKRLVKREKVRSTSVSAESFLTHMRLLQLLLFVAALAVLGYVVYEGLRLFLS